MTITWTTTEAATTRVDWGAGSSTNHVVPDDGTYSTSHMVTITGLLPNSIYSVIVSGHDEDPRNDMSFICGLEPALYPCRPAASICSSRRFLHSPPP
jgi:hypothetical protein